MDNFHPLTFVLPKLRQITFSAGSLLLPSGIIGCTGLGGQIAFMKIEQLRQRGLRAFSLAETVVGMAIVGILTVAIYSALTTGFNTVRLAREDQRATQILVQLMDQLRILSWSQLTNGTNVPSLTIQSFDPEKTVVVHGAWNTNKLMNLGFMGTITLTDAPNDTTYSSQMKQVTVNVVWTSLSGRRRAR